MTSRNAFVSHIDDLVDPIQRAAHELVHDYRDGRTGRRGAPALAPLLGMNPGTLANKCNPMQEHHLTLAESVQLQAASHDYRILRAYAGVLGHAVYQLPDSTAVGDLELLSRYSEYHARVGAQAAEIRRALADHRITQGEVDRIKTAFQDVISTGLALLARFDALVDD